MNQDGNQSIYYPNLCNLMTMSIKDLKKKKQYGLIRLLFEYTDIKSFSIDWVFLYYKSDRDILQGISKLDNIIKVSVI